MNWKMIAAVTLCAGIVACGPAAEDGASQGLAASPGQAVPAPAAAASEPAFSALLSGAVDAEIAGSESVSGALYGRYHINMASPRTASETATVIAFGRPDQSTPTVGTYALGDGGAFGGSVELYSDPQRDFAIISGELLIIEAVGDALEGTFTLTAQELVEEYTDSPPTLRVEGTFKTQPAR